MTKEERIIKDYKVPFKTFALAFYPMRSRKQAADRQRRLAAYEAEVLKAIDNHTLSREQFRHYLFMLRDNTLNRPQSPDYDVMIENDMLEDVSRMMLHNEVADLPLREILYREDLDFRGSFYIFVFDVPKTYRDFKVVTSGMIGNVCTSVNLDWDYCAHIPHLEIYTLIRVWRREDGRPWQPFKKKKDEPEQQNFMRRALGLPYQNIKPFNNYN